MTKTATKTYLVGVIERAICYYKVEVEDARTATENWQDGQFWDSDDEALDSEGPCNVREQQPDGTFLKLPKSQWQADPAAGGIPGKTSFPSCCSTPTMPTTAARKRIMLSSRPRTRSKPSPWPNGGPPPVARAWR